MTYDYLRSDARFESARATDQSGNRGWAFDPAPSTRRKLGDLAKGLLLLAGIIGLWVLAAMVGA